MSQAYTTKVINNTFFDQITSDDPGMQKNAAQAVNDFTRMQMREEGFWRKIIPPVTLTNDEIDRAVDTDKNMKIVEREPNSPAAVSIPYGTLPMNRYIKGWKYRVMFDRIVTPRFTKDISELRTYDMDIRQVLSDNAIKDMLAEEDGKAIRAVNTILGTAGSTVTETGTIQHRNIAGALSRYTYNQALKILPSTPAHLETATVLINNVTVKDLQTWGRDEVGGDLAEEILLKGYSEATMLNTRVLVTIKRDLVPDNAMYMFADPKFLGKFFILEDTTMNIKRDAFMIDFYAYEELGSAIGNVAGVARANFVP